MGWSLVGADKMAKLRAYFWNKKDMLELVRYQSEYMPRKKVSGDEFLSCFEVTKTKKAHSPYGKFYDQTQVYLPAQTRKVLAIRERLRFI